MRNPEREGMEEESWMRDHEREIMENQGGETVAEKSLGLNHAG